VYAIDEILLTLTTEQFVILAFNFFYLWVEFLFRQSLSDCVGSSIR